MSEARSLPLNRPAKTDPTRHDLALRRNCRHRGGRAAARVRNDDCEQVVYEFDTTTTVDADETYWLKIKTMA